MVLLVLWQAVARYLLNNPSSFSEALTRYLFVWLVLITSTYAFGSRDHMYIAALNDKLKGKTKTTVNILIEALTILFAGCVMVYGGSIITRMQMVSLDSSLHIPMGVVYGVIPVCGVLIVFYCIITLMIGLSSIMSWVMAFTGLPDLIANGILSLTGNKYVILILMNIILLIVGTFMDPTPAVLIFTPIFLPICKTFGMHAVQFGIMVSMNLCIGTITPPVGSILFTGCKVGHVKIEQVIKELLPYFFAILAALLLVTYIPAISMTLPTLAGLIK